MKKITAIFMLMVMLLAASHATVAFHYCGGEFRSLAFNSEIKSCCGEEEHQKSQGDEIQNASCCSNRYQAVCTDDFSTNKPASAIGNDKAFQPAAYVPEVLFNIGEIIAPQSFQHVFPPGSLAASGMERLIFICVLRI